MRLEFIVVQVKACICLVLNLLPTDSNVLYNVFIYSLYSHIHSTLVMASGLHQY